MGRFSELNQNVNYVAELLLENENLMKLIKYDTSDPLSSTPVTTPNSLLFDRIFPTPKSVNAITEKKTLLTYVFSNGKLENNLKFKKSKLIFNIISHIDLWKINGNIRVYSIIDELDNIFNELRSSKLSIGKVLFSDLLYNNL